MNTHELKPGDRIRLRRRFRLRGYRRRDKGVVVHELAAGTVTPRHYRVAMDRDGPTGWTILLTEKAIERDG
jgi:hypothetical protein